MHIFVKFKLLDLKLHIESFLFVLAYCLQLTALIIDKFVINLFLFSIRDFQSCNRT